MLKVKNQKRCKKTNANKETQIKEIYEDLNENGKDDLNLNDLNENEINNINNQ